MYFPLQKYIKNTDKMIVMHTRPVCTDQDVFVAKTTGSASCVAIY